MNISTTDTDDTNVTGETVTETETSRTLGALADGLTLVRVFIAPIVALVIIYGWPSTGFAVLASVLFAIGALTDLLDDMIGGKQRAKRRMFGWFDDIADSILIGAALLAMIYVTRQGGILTWMFAVPVTFYIARDIIIGLTKGYDFSANGAPQSRLGDIKSAIAMIGVSLMIASPWLQQLIDRLRAGDDGEKLMAIYNAPSPWVWAAGQGLLWISAILALITAVGYFMAKPAEKDV